MKIYDISMPISEDMQVYKNRDAMRPQLKVVRDHQSSTAYESQLTMHLHTGTHMDAPLHMIDGGKTIDTVELKKLITWCKVIDLTDVKDGITHEDLKDKAIEPGDFVLLKTKNSFSDTFDDGFVFVEKSGAQYLKETGISGVGIDSLGIERSQLNHETHTMLLGEWIPILEGLCLKDIREGRYFLFAVPISIAGAEAAPVRALLLSGVSIGGR